MVQSVVFNRIQADRQKQQELAQASSDYMRGKIGLKKLRELEEENSPDYSSASLVLVGLGKRLTGLSLFLNLAGK